jgi:hypothetical protein
MGVATPLRPATFTGELSYPRFRTLNRADTTPVGIGRTWTVPDALKNAGLELSKIPRPNYPTREKYLDLESKNKVLTNHFEYSVAAAVFYEYKLNNIGSKDKKRTKEAYQNAIES